MRKKKKKRSLLPGLGYSPAHRTGAGTHGGDKRQRSRRERQAGRRQAREWE